MYGLPDPAEFQKGLEKGYLFGVCLICKEKEGKPHDKAKHALWEKTEATLRAGVVFEYSDGTKEEVRLEDDGRLRGEEI